MCLGLVEFYVRRSPLFLAYRDHGLSLLPMLAHEMQQELGWSDSRRHEQEESVRAYIRKELAWKQNFGISASNL